MRLFFYAFLISFLFPSFTLAAEMCLYFAQKHVERKTEESRDVLAVCLAAGCENAKLIARHNLENGGGGAWGSNLLTAFEIRSLTSACAEMNFAQEQEEPTQEGLNQYADLPGLEDVEDREGDGTTLYELPEWMLEPQRLDERLILRPNEAIEGMRAMPSFN